jgi:hypothetical protein
MDGFSDLRVDMDELKVGGDSPDRVPLDVDGNQLRPW